jgi:hypothetical protein
LINNISPFSTLKSTLNVMINSNYSNLYSSLIKYQCVYGNSKSDAILLNNQFNCTFNKISPNSGFNVSLIIVSNLKNQEILFSQNSLLFYFMGLKLFYLSLKILLKFYLFLRMYWDIILQMKARIQQFK